MRWCCCDSQHAAVAPGAISLSQPLSCSTGRGEHWRISTLGKNIRASDSNLPCIIPSLRSSRALRCWLHKHHSNCCVKTCNIRVVRQWGERKKKKKMKRQQLNVGGKKMWQRISTQHALCSVLAPPIIPTTKTKKKRRKEDVILNVQIKTSQRTGEWDYSGLHQSISLKGAWELASSQ